MSQENNKPSRNQGGQGNRNRNKNNNRNRNNQGNRKNGPRRRALKPLPLTTWQKFLKFLGLYKEPTRPPRRQSDKQTSEKGNKKVKSNTRNARGKGKQPSQNSKREFPVETPRLYLGNLSYEADESSLEDLFKGIGNVRKVEIVYNHHTHRSKGFGFIEMQTIEEAKRAVEVLHDQPFMGRNLVVNGATNKPKPKPRRDKPNSESKPQTEKEVSVPLVESAE